MRDSNIDAQLAPEAVVAVIVVVVALFNVFKRPNCCIGQPSLCPDRPSYIEKR
jgi:hypothetical protein